MARGTQTAVFLLCVLAAVLLVDARHLMATEEPLQSAKSDAVQQASADVAEVEEVQQLSQLVGDITEEEGGLELQAALWKRAQKQGKCIYKNKIVECQHGNSYPKEDSDYDGDSRGYVQSKQGLEESVKASISTYVVPDDNYNDTDYDDDDDEDEVIYDDGSNDYIGGKHKGKHAGKHSKGAHHAARQHIKRSKASHKLDSDKGYGYSADSYPHQHYFPRMDYGDQQPSYNSPPRYNDPTNQLTYAPSTDTRSDYYAEGPASEPDYGHSHNKHIHSKTPGSGEYDSHPHVHKIHSKRPGSGDYDGQPHIHHIHSKTPKHEDSQYGSQYGSQYDSQYDSQYGSQYDSQYDSHHSHSKTPKYERDDSTAYEQPSHKHHIHSRTPSYEGADSATYGQLAQKHHIHSRTPSYEGDDSIAYGQPVQKHHHHLLHKHKTTGHKGSNKTSGYGKAYDEAPATYQEPDTYEDDDNTYSEDDDTYSPPSSQYSSSKDSTPPSPKSSYSGNKESKPSYPDTQYAKSSKDSTPPDTDSEYASSQESKPSHPKNTYGNNKSSNKGSSYDGAKDTHKGSYSAPPPPAQKYTGKSGYERDLQDTIGRPPKPNTKSYKRDPLEYWEEDEDQSDADGYNLEVYAQVASPVQAVPAAATQKAVLSAAAKPAAGATFTVLGAGQSE